MLIWAFLGLFSGRSYDSVKLRLLLYLRACYFYIPLLLYTLDRQLTALIGRIIDGCFIKKIRNGDRGPTSAAHDVDRENGQMAWSQRWVYGGWRLISTVSNFRCMGVLCTTLHGRFETGVILIMITLKQYRYTNQYDNKIEAFKWNNAHNVIKVVTV